ncbi:MAG TPA: HAD family phosphatase [Actinomycetota bacterium]|nr:HAD family phosphatase [Actinomycetota bacterium]
MTGELDACILDFGGVLTTPILASFQEFERALDVEPGTVLEAFRHHPEDAEPDFFLLEKGLISEGEFYSRMLARLREYTGRDVQFPEEPAEVRRKLFGALDRNDDMIAAAVRIGAHYKTAILTNNVREWEDWREMVDAHIFDLVVDSSHVGMRKPDPEIYRLTCRELGVEPGRAAFVDDIPSNVRGARAVGLHAIRFTTTEEVIEQLRPLFPRAFEGSQEIAHA